MRRTYARKRPRPGAVAPPSGDIVARSPVAALQGARRRLFARPRTVGAARDAAASRPRSWAASSSASSIASTDGPGKVQAFLDLGESGVPRECAKCGMAYTPGLAEDEREHRAHCKAATGLVAFPASMTGARVRWQRAAAGEIGLLRVTAADPRPLRARCDALRRRVIDALGSYAASEGTAPAVYVVLDARRLAVACALVCGVARAGRAVQPGPGAGYSMGADFSRTAPAPVAVTHVWVHPDHRRLGLATAAVDEARRTYCLHGPVPRAEVAFSQPTEAGWRFAAAFTGRDDFAIFS